MRWLLLLRACLWATRGGVCARRYMLVFIHFVYDSLIECVVVLQHSGAIHNINYIEQYPVSLKLAQNQQCYIEHLYCHVILQHDDL